MRSGKAAAVFALLLGACTTVQLGRDFDLAGFEARVRRDSTTQAQVRSWLGEPTGVGVSVESSGERYEEWTYYFGEGRLADLTDARVKVLQVKFDAQRIVRAYNWSGEPR